VILVVGATGYLGGMITQKLLAQGQDVRILVRTHSDYQSLLQAGARPVVGDLKDRPSLDPACDGVATIITTANSASRGGEDNPQTVDLQGNHNLINAAKSAGVKQFIFTSALGADSNSPVPFFQAKGRSEVYLRDSGMPYTILAPTIFMDIWVPMVIGTPLRAGQPVTLVGEGRRKHSFIAVTDVAAFATAAIGHEAAMNQYLPLGGPEAVSWRDVIATVQRVLGREIAVQSVAPGEPVPGLPEVAAGLMSALETYDSIIDMMETARTFGVRQTTLEEFIRQAFTDARAVAQ
jgi:uncharacterized protein YbjT (DUF2867 family)